MRYHPYNDEEATSHDDFFHLSRPNYNIPSSSSSENCPASNERCQEGIPIACSLNSRRRPSVLRRHSSAINVGIKTQIDGRIDCWATKNEFPTRARNSSTSGRAEEPIIACFSKYLHQINDKSPSDPVNVWVIIPWGLRNRKLGKNRGKLWVLHVLK